MKITLKDIKDKSPCQSGWETLLKSFKKTQADDTVVSIAHLLKSNGVFDTLWVIKHCFPDELEKRYNIHADFVESAIEHAERVLPIFEKERAGDNRPRLAIEESKKCVNLLRSGDAGAVVPARAAGDAIRAAIRAADAGLDAIRAASAAAWAADAAAAWARAAGAGIAWAPGAAGAVVPARAAAWAADAAGDAAGAACSAARAAWAAADDAADAAGDAAGDAVRAARAAARAAWAADAARAAAGDAVAGAAVRAAGGAAGDAIRAAENQEIEKQKLIILKYFG